MLMVLLAFLIASTALDPDHAALARIVAESRVADGCSDAQRAAAVAGADLKPIGTSQGRRVALVALGAACLCGHNCPWLVVRFGDHGADVLLETFAYSVTPIGPGVPLPDLREQAHDNALISDETIDTFRNGRYVATASYRVRGDTGERKPNAVEVRFAPGASSAPLRGRVSAGWYDSYTFGANKDQRVTIDAVHSAAHMRFTLRQRDGNAQDLVAGKSIILDRSGVFVLNVENDRSTDEPPVPYSAVLSIR